ncbi:hypothetical protein Ccl03g_32420 [Enterocloster clostridioformis]|uniref:Uncharacterized protein n=1 Tax=Enterocloster clostridioformis TaxID=1531 RepID=A0A829VZ45_9FIRM|nr:hypothetical protein HMPREF1087_01158 [[Clostridium] clostridioforme 90A1]ENZ74492.1 hypothetical protein HMPREF1081_00014 [[Clostridium] clostridioforme 90A4]GEA37529.1 hypothetical protein Ccl03g_32420 [Enterocloster clostridioformis]
MISQVNIRCEWCSRGYCEYYCSAEEQELRETNWPYKGTEDEMVECGQLKQEVLI